MQNLRREGRYKDPTGPDSMKAATGGEFLYGFNVRDRDARMWMDAMFLYLSKTFGADDCFISNWVLGNEINSCSFYWYMGNPSEDEFTDNYTNCFRDFYNAVRSVRGSSRVFICLEHCWTTTNDVTLGFQNFRVPSFWNDEVADNAGADVFRYMDTPQYLQYTQPVLNAAVGAGWERYVTGSSMRSP